MILEEAALSAENVGTVGLLWSPLSVRKVAQVLGIGRDAAARGLALLLSEGVLCRAYNRRGAAGRFGPGGYWLVAPAGVAISGVARCAESGDPGHGEPCPVVPATVTVEGARRTKDRRRGGGRWGEPEPEPCGAGQASLFSAGVGEEGAGHVATVGTPPVVGESDGAVLSVGCDVVNRVHELAPGVPAGAHPGIDPSLLSGGDGGC